MSKKRVRSRVPKEQRKNLRLWAEGARQEVLEPHIEPYSEALVRGWRDERNYLNRVSREYHARISWRLKDHEEPESLLPFDAEALIPEETLTAEEEVKKCARIKKLDERIRRWLKYRARVLRKKARARADARKDPYAVLLAKLSGVKCPPKARQAFQQYMHEQYHTEIAPAVLKEWAAHQSEGSSVSTTKDPNAPFRAKVARDLFSNLPTDEQQRYRDTAKAEAVAARLAYETALAEPPSQAPQDRQQAIDGVGAFLAPILQGVSERTGMHAVVLLGGPVPIYGGDLRTIHVSYGRNRTALASHFPVWAKERFNGVLDLFKEYLHTAFDSEDIKNAALLDGLDGAKYTMPNLDVDDDASDSDSESSASDSEGEGEAPARKKRKKQAEKPGRATTSTSEPKKAVKRAGKGKRAEKAAKGEAANVKRAKEGMARGKQVSKARTSKAKASADAPEPPTAIAPVAEDPVTPRRSGRNHTSTTTPSAPGAAAADGEDSGSGSDSDSLFPSDESDEDSSSDSDEEGDVTGTKRRQVKDASQPAKKPKNAKTTGTDPAKTVPRPSGDGAAPPPPTVEGATAPRPTPDGATPPPPTLEGAAAAPHPTPDSAGPPPPTLVDGNGATGPRTTPDSHSAAPPLSTPQGAALAPHPTLDGAAPPPPTLVDGNDAAAPHPTPDGDGAAAPHPTPDGDGATAPSPPTLVDGASSLPVFPAGTPKWLMSAIKDIAGAPLGASYTSVLEAIIRVEGAQGFDADVTALSKVGRPDVISTWVKGGRGSKSKKIPFIKKLDAYPKAWQGWWDSLQPKWRRRGANGQWSIGGDYGEDWDILDCRGVNGVINLPASLYFWGLQVHGARETEGEEWFGENVKVWDAAVHDVAWMLDGLYAYLV